MSLSSVEKQERTLRRLLLLEDFINHFNFLPDWEKGIRLFFTYNTFGFKQPTLRAAWDETGICQDFATDKPLPADIVKNLKPLSRLKNHQDSIADMLYELGLSLVQHNACDRWLVT